MKENKILDSSKRVLEIEAKGITALAENLDGRFEELVELCLACSGKVVLTGMGKSGHVAKKISATLSSLGTPSFFLHPAEAAHGDLGMIQHDDIIIMLSNSGETDELIQLLNTIRIIGCKLIGVFCRKNSTLEKYCDLTIVIPIEREACIHNLAPTTSSTVTMALGDALAVVLSELKGFRANDFALFHPRGTLGKRLLITAIALNSLSISEIAVSEKDSIESVLWVITKNHAGAVAVVNEELELKGFISDGDIRRLIERRQDIFQISATEIMTRDPVSVQENMLAIDVFHLMQEKKISVVPIVSVQGKLTGMISMHDIVEAGIVG